ncbi:MAG: hypothetical protein HYZ58_00120 [Acidobacteria bacterium]|nr:hypothetical protein [Acidobacteriota bacterium]
MRNDVRAFDEGLRELVSSQLVLPSFTLQEVLEAVVLEVNSLKVPENLTGEQARHVAALRDLVQINKSWLLDADGPLWFRGYANWTAEEGPRLIGPILRKYNARYLVVGHTPMATTRITPRFDNRVFLIDTGMLSSYYKGGRASALEIQNGRFTAIYADERVPLEW